MSEDKEFIVVADSTDIELGQSVSLEVNEVQVLLCRTRDGIFAIEDQCTHANEPLCGGRIDGNLISCPVHGAIFDVRNGAGYTAGNNLDTIRTACTIEAIVRKVMKYNDVHQLIVINDASTDRTPEILKSLAEEFHCIEVMHHLYNSGKTAALKLGFSAISGDVVVIQDADLEYDPEEIPALIEPIVKGWADVVYGSRFRLRKTGRVMYFYHYLATVSYTHLTLPTILLV